MIILPINQCALIIEILEGLRKSTQTEGLYAMSFIGKMTNSCVEPESPTDKRLPSNNLIHNMVMFGQDQKSKM